MAPRFFVWVVRSVSALPFARIDVIPPALLQIVGYDALAVFAALALRRERYTVAARALGIALVLVIVPHFQNGGTLRFDAIDVGRADALLVRTPGEHANMIDTGGKLEHGANEENGGSPAEAVGERIIVPTLLRARIRQLDGIIVTHPHGNHKGIYAHLVLPFPDAT